MAGLGLLMTPIGMILLIVLGIGLIYWRLPRVFERMIGRTPTGAAVRLGILGVVFVYWGFTFVHLKGGFNPLAGFILFLTDGVLWRNFVTDFYANGGSELLSIAVTVLIIERLTQLRQDAQELRRLKALMGSNERVVMKIAVAELKARSWLEDGSLKEVQLNHVDLSGEELLEADLEGVKLISANLEATNLSDANLVRANISRANLRNCDLWRANLSAATLNKANLNGADLKSTNMKFVECWEANLRRADLWGADLRESDLWKSNLKEVNLKDAKLQGAGLGFANLEGANLEGAVFDEETVLPDGSKWFEDVDMDMEKFTNPEHPEFVRYETIWDE